MYILLTVIKLISQYFLPLMTRAAVGTLMVGFPDIPTLALTETLALKCPSVDPMIMIFLCNYKTRFSNSSQEERPLLHNFQECALIKKD